MTRRLAAVALFLVLVLTGCSSGSRGPAAEQESFGVRMARMNLWREAMFRFERAVAMNPDDAMAHNNLAVAYEANGDFEAAAKAYREALRLDRSNEYIQKNYSRFVEFTTRDRRRQQQQPRRAPAQAVATPAEEEADDEPASPAPADDPVEPSAPVADDPAPQPAQEPPAADPAPTGAAPAQVPPPNPSPQPPSPPDPPAPDPGGLR